MTGLTRRQQDALRFIAGHIEARGCAPTYREIADGLGLRTKAGAHRLVMCLEDRGAVRTTMDKTRGIEVLRSIAIPRAPDGTPLRHVAVKGGAT